MHLVHAAVAGGIQLGVIHKAPRINGTAGRAYAAGRSRDAALLIGTHAIERLGQNARYRCLAHAPRTRKQVSMVQALALQRIGKGGDDMALAHHFDKVFGAVFTRQNKRR